MSPPYNNNKNNQGVETTNNGDLLYSFSSSFTGPLTFSPTKTEKTGRSSNSDSDNEAKHQSSSHHARSLSDHFQEATKLNYANGAPGYDHSRNEHKLSEDGHIVHKIKDSEELASKVGRKHRRGLSGGQSNPAVAHRRINSRGNTAFVDRNHHHIFADRYQQPHAPMHHRLRSRSLSPPSQHLRFYRDREPHRGNLHPSSSSPDNYSGLTSQNHDGGYVKKSQQYDDINYKRNGHSILRSRRSSPPSFYPRNPHHYSYPTQHHQPEEAQKRSIPPRSDNYHSSSEHYDRDHFYYQKSNTFHPGYPPSSNMNSSQMHHQSYNTNYKESKTIQLHHIKSQPDLRSVDRKYLPVDKSIDHHVAGEVIPPRHRTLSSFSSIGSDFKIDTDEPLFSKETTHPPYVVSSLSPTNLRASPKLFMQSLNEPMERRPSPPSLYEPYNGTNMPKNNLNKQNMPVVKGNYDSHHRNASSVSSSTLNHIFDDIKHGGNHARTWTETFTNGTDNSFFDISSNFAAFPDAEKDNLQRDNSKYQQDSSQFQTVETKPTPVKSNNVWDGEPTEINDIDAPSDTLTSIKNEGACNEEKKLNESNEGIAYESSNANHQTANKRMRRKCKVEGCINRIVEGGVCIRHGAKRKKCGFPGCTKHVKKAGMCSAHGPSRKKCDVEGCIKVAVKGGRCLSHGASKKLCSVENCKKQAILSGMCKKHHDEQQPMKGKTVCRPCDVGDEINSSTFRQQDEEISNNMATKSKNSSKKPAHQRGLSFFDDMQAVDIIISSGKADGTHNKKS